MKICLGIETCQPSGPQWEKCNINKNINVMIGNNTTTIYSLIMCQAFYILQYSQKHFEDGTILIVSFYR